MQVEEPTLRDRFAMAALQGEWAAQDGISVGVIGIAPEDLIEAAKRYYAMADAMLKVRELNPTMIYRDTVNDAKLKIATEVS